MSFRALRSFFSEVAQMFSRKAKEMQKAIVPIATQSVARNLLYTEPNHRLLVSEQDRLFVKTLK
jgi:hypothetical protein